MPFRDTSEQLLPSKGMTFHVRWLRQRLTPKISRHQHIQRLSSKQIISVLAPRADVADHL